MSQPSPAGLIKIVKRPTTSLLYFFPRKTVIHFTSFTFISFFVTWLSAYEKFTPLGELFYPSENTLFSTTALLWFTTHIFTFFIIIKFFKYAVCSGCITINTIFSANGIYTFLDCLLITNNNSI